MPICQRASRRMCAQILSQPRLLGRTRLAPANILALSVECHDVPSAQFVAVVAFRRIAGSRTEIVEVRSAARAVKLVIPRDGTRSRLKCAPGFVITIREFFRSSIGERQVADGGNGAWDSFDDVGGSLCAGNDGAVRDVTRRQQDW